MSRDVTRSFVGSELFRKREPANPKCFVTFRIPVHCSAGSISIGDECVVPIRELAGLEPEYIASARLSDGTEILPPGDAVRIAQGLVAEVRP